jgi:hypothetical protein
MPSEVHHCRYHHEEFLGGETLILLFICSAVNDFGF